MPWRSAAPEVEMRKPAAARPPMTVGPLQPGDGCAATPTGLFGGQGRCRRTVVHDLQVFDRVGDDVHGAPGGGSRLREAPPLARDGASAADDDAGGRPLPWGRGAAPDGRSRTCGPALRHTLALKAVGHRKRSDLGKGTHQVEYAATPGGPLVRPGGRDSVPVEGAVRVQAAEGQPHDEDAAADDRGVGEVEDGEVLRVR